MWIRGKKNYVIGAEVPVGHPPPDRMPSPPYTGMRSARVSLLKFFLAMARGGVLNATPTDVFLEMLSLFMLLSRHVYGGSDLRMNSDFFDNPRYVDFYFKYLMGRMGNALGLLYLEERNFPWFAHFEDVNYAVHAPKVPSPSNRPDFLSANDREVVLLECKGTSANKAWSGGKTSVTQAYRNQVAPWIGGRIDKVPIEAGYSVVSQLRKSHGTTILSLHTSTSATHPSLPSESVVRANYAKSMELIGGQFWTLAASLSSRVRVPDRTRLLRRRVGGIPFLFLSEGSVASPQPFLSLFRIRLGIEEEILELLTSLVRSTESEVERAAILERLSLRTQEIAQAALDIVQEGAEISDEIAAFLDGTIAIAEDRFVELPSEGETTVRW